MNEQTLTDLIDTEVLQKIQDSFAAATGLHVLTRDAAGRTVTRHSHPTRLCDVLGRDMLRDLFGEPMDAETAKGWEPTDEHPVAAANIVESIGTSEQCLGSIEMIALLGTGEPPAPALDTLSNELGMDPERLRQLVQDSTKSTPEEIEGARQLLQSIADVLSTLCERSAEADRQMRELSTLRHVAGLLTAATGLQERLDLLTAITTETLGVKACLIRLLDEDGDELLIKAVHNLSRRYLEKGPVRLSDSLVDQKALDGQTTTIPDVTQDPGSIYPRKAAEEGLCSMLCTGLRSKGRPIGTIRVYTGQPYQFTVGEKRLLEAIANQAASAIENAALHERALRAQALDSELAAAAEIQRRLLPERDPVLPGFQIASRYIPHGTVGGDFFDFVTIKDQHLGIAIADVAGKGVPGAILMAATRAVLRGHIDTVYAAGDIVASANRSLCRDIAEDQFVTLFYGALDTANRRLTYCNAGHMAPLLFRGSQHCELMEGGLVLGVDPDTHYEERQAALASDDVLLFFTDGLTETMDPDGRTFGRKRVIHAVEPHIEKPAPEILDGVWTAVRAFARGAEARDDFTIIVLKVE